MRKSIDILVIYKENHFSPSKIILFLYNFYMLLPALKSKRM